MTAGIPERIEHCRVAIGNLRNLLTGKALDDFLSDPHLRAAAERYLEIISEASRHIPADEKTKFPAVPWRNIAGIGNILRHGYQAVDARSLWDTCQNDLQPLSKALNAMVNESFPTAE